MMRVRIYQPTKTAMQSGRAKHNWLIEPELLSARRPESLMGWLSSSDTFSELQNRLRFKSLEEAIAFAQKQGFEYYIEENAERHISPRSYMDNFRITRPEDEEREQAYTQVS